MDYNKESRVSIPPIEYGIEVREPIASEDHDNSVNNAIVGYSIAKVVDPKEEKVGDTFDENGNYNKTKWETGDRISEGKLNKIEDAIDKVNKNEINNTMILSKRIDNNFNVLDSIKADKNEIFSMANMGQDIKEAMTGGSVAVVGKNAVLTDNILDGQVTRSKRTRSSDNLIFLAKSGFDFDTKNRKLVNKSPERYFGVNYGNGHIRGTGENNIYFDEISLPGNIGYIWFNPTKTGSNAFITPVGELLPSDVENCIIFGAYDFNIGYFHLNGIEFTVDGEPYNSGYTLRHSNDITGEIGTVFSNTPPNFNSVTKQLEINATCGVLSRLGHHRNDTQKLNLVTGYIGFNVSTLKYVMITNNQFIPGKDILVVGYSFPDYNRYFLYGDYTVDGVKEYASYAYSKKETDDLITSSKSEVINTKYSVMLYKNTLKETLDDFEENVDGIIDISSKGVKFLNENARITLKNEYSIEQRKTSINFELGENGVLSFFYKTYEGYNLGGSIFTVDGKNNEIVLHQQYATTGVVPSRRVSKPYSFVVGRCYNLTLIKKKRRNIMIVTDGITGESVTLETDCTAVIGDLVNEFAGGRQNGRFGVWNRGGLNNYISNLYITTNIKEPLLYMTGDSICEGDRCEIGYRYADLCEKTLGVGNVAISGMSGTKITGVKLRLQSELPHIKPQYCMVTIGTNGGNSVELIQDLIEYIESLDIIPIINHVSQTSGGTANYINSTIDQFSEYVGCKFDIATSINNDITLYYDSSLFGDNVHPNEKGHAKMYDRFKTDVPYLIY